MKAVVYHADSHFAWGGQVGDIYKKSFEGFKRNCHKYGIQVVHLTINDHPVWGDESVRYGGFAPKNVMFNRELLFAQYLEESGKEGEVYWFTEPDYRIFREFPPLQADCALLYRADDDVRITPSWRMGTVKALPFFKKWAAMVQTVEWRQGVGKDWHCDSDVFNRFYKDAGKPTKDFEYLGVKVEFRNYYDYIKGKCKFGRNFLSNRKGELLKWDEVNGSG